MLQLNAATSSQQKIRLQKCYIVSVIACNLLDNQVCNNMITTLSHTEKLLV